jgi:anti-anti-sigma factor
MAIQNWSDDVVLVELPSEPYISDDLGTVTELVRDRGDCDVVIDFSSVDIVTSSSLSKFLRLQKLLTDCGHRLIMCNLAPATAGIFTVTGLEDLFEIVEDKTLALASLQIA